MKLAILGAIGAAAIGYNRPYMGAATFALSCFLAGLAERKTPRTHARWMSAGMLLDLSLVLVLEATRGAIAVAVGDELDAWQRAHVGVSVLAVALYVPVFALGMKLLRGSGGPRARTWHLRLALAALGFRVLGYALMFSLWTRGA